VGVGGEYAFLINWLATTGVGVATNINVVKAGLNFKFDPF
jgi:hypothetical protein